MLIRKRSDNMKPHTVNNIAIRGSIKTRAEQVADTEKWICRDIKRAYADAGMPTPACRCRRA